MHCLVTGGTRGIGHAIAVLAARRGHAVTVVGRNPAVPLDAAIQVLQGDVASEADVLRIFAQAQAGLGPVDALVNAAGMAYNARVVDLDADTVTRLLLVNVLGTMLCCREAVRRMAPAGAGAIVNISSMAATIGGRPGASAYAASKAAVDSFTTGLAREVAAQGIRVNAIRPGVVETEMTARVVRDPAIRARVAASIPMQRLGRPQEVAEVALWLLSDAASLVTGAHVDAGGGGFMVAGLA